MVVRLLTFETQSKLKLKSKQISQLSRSLKSLQAELQALVNSNYFSLKDACLVYSLHLISTELRSTYQVEIEGCIKVCKVTELKYTRCYESDGDLINYRVGRVIISAKE